MYHHSRGEADYERLNLSAMGGGSGGCDAVPGGCAIRDDVTFVATNSVGATTEAERGGRARG